MVGDAAAASAREREFDRLGAEIARHRDLGRTVVHCHGVFDLLHPGHLAHLEEARGLGDVLVVTVTPDRYVNKGPGRPVFPAEHRARMIAALAVVDVVSVTQSATAVEAIDVIRPDVFVKGPDYARPDADVTGNMAREIEAVERHGGRVHITVSPALSSSQIINAHFPPSDPGLAAWIAEFRRRHEPAEVIGWLTRLAGLRVLVVGEAIIDEYVTCEALGKSSKDPVLAFREMDLERQAGGSLAIANHCAALGADVTVLCRLGDDDADESFVRTRLLPGVEFVALRSPHERTIVKRRYVDSVTEARVFETYVMHEGPPHPADDAAAVAALRDRLGSFDVVLVADYGHGLLSQDVIDQLTGARCTVAVNTQSNAGNRGYNTISRYPHADVVCLNGGEVSLEMRRRDLTMEQLIPQLRQRTSAIRAIVTEGARGLTLCGADDSVVHVPAFATIVRDRVGAGDAVFATATLLTAAGAPLDITGLYGNLAGAAAVMELGNRVPVRGADLARHVEALLR